METVASSFEAALHSTSTALSAGKAAATTEISPTLSSSSSSATVSNYDQMLSGISMALYRYGMLVVTIAGSLGNFLSMAVMIRRRFRLTSSGQYLFALALVNQVIIVTAALGRHVVRTWTGVDYPTVNQYACKWLYFTSVSAAQSSLYIVAFMSLERAIVTWRPLQFRAFFTVATARVSIVVIVTVLASKSVHLWWSQGATYATTENGTLVTVSQCGIVTGPLHYFSTQVRPYLDYTFTLLAGIITLACNAVIIRAVSDSLRLHSLTVFAAGAAAAAGANKPAAGGLKHADRQLTPLLVTTAIVFIILTIPLQVVSIFYPVNPNDVGGSSMGKLLWSIGLVTTYANSASSFYIYCCSGRHFRKEFVDMLTCRTMAPGQSTVFYLGSGQGSKFCNLSQPSCHTS